MDLKPGDPVIIIYSQGKPNEWIATTAIKNIGARYITVCDYPDRFNVSTKVHRHTQGYGHDVLVHRDSEAGQQAVARQRVRTLEDWAQQKCYEFYRNSCKPNRQAALDALNDYDATMNDMGK